LHPSKESRVRIVTLVGRVGLEPATYGLKVTTERGQVLCGRLSELLLGVTVVVQMFYVWLLITLLVPRWFFVLLRVCRISNHSVRGTLWRPGVGGRR
jgi:hypothetical protein